MTDESKPTATVSVQTVTNSNAFTVLDSQGRTLEYRGLNAVEKGRLMRAAGPHASNQTFFGYAVASVGVRLIDGVPTGLFPRTMDDIDAVIGLVGDEGLEAISTELIKRNPTDEEVTEAAKN